MTLRGTEHNLTRVRRSISKKINSRAQTSPYASKHAHSQIPWNAIQATVCTAYCLHIPVATRFTRASTPWPHFRYRSTSMA